MLRSDMTEAKSGVIAIEDTEPLVIKQLLNFLYTAKVDFAGLKEEQNLITKLNEEMCGKLAVAAYLHGADVWQKNFIYDYISEHWKALGVKKEFEALVKACLEAFLKD